MKTQGHRFGTQMNSPPSNIGEAWRLASQRIDRLDARLLLEHTGACRHADLIAHPERALSVEQAILFTTLVDRRANGEPLAYLLGSAWFAGLEFAVSPAVLIPRPETELLVQLALARVQHLATPRIVDLGTGSGIVAVTLANRCPNAEVSAVDLSPAALAVARSNAERHAPQVRFLAGDWCAPLCAARFDLIVGNPPYIVAGDPHLSADGLPYEPQLALTDGVAGGDGLACIRAIVRAAPRHLVEGAWLLIEHGYDQAAAVRALLRDDGFTEIASWRDSAGIERVSGGQKMTGC